MHVLSIQLLTDQSPFAEHSPVHSAAGCQQGSCCNGRTPEKFSPGSQTACPLALSLVGKVLGEGFHRGHDELPTAHCWETKYIINSIHSYNNDTEQNFF